MYRRRKALLLEWPISATKPEFKKSPFEVDASATSIESIFPVKQNSKKQAALCACTQLHATRKISYNCRGIIESARKQSHFISNTNIWRFCRLRTTNCLQLCSDMFRSFWMIPCLVRGRRGKISKQFVNPFIQLASTFRCVLRLFDTLSSYAIPWHSNSKPRGIRKLRKKSVATASFSTSTETNFRSCCVGRSQDQFPVPSARWEPQWSLASKPQTATKWTDMKNESWWIMHQHE